MLLFKPCFGCRRPPTTVCQGAGHGQACILIYSDSESGTQRTIIRTTDCALASQTTSNGIPLRHLLDFLDTTDHPSQSCISVKNIPYS
jgi:hypothetical protein